MEKLQKDCKTRLKQEFIKRLPELTVVNNRYINYSSSMSFIELDKILPSSGEVFEKYRNLIGENPFYTFALDELQRKLNGYQYDSSAKEIKYLSLFEKGTNESMIESIIEAFDNLPKNYKIFIRLPDSFNYYYAMYESVINVNDGISIVKISDDFITNNKLDTISKEIASGLFKWKFVDFFNDHNSLEKDKFYLQINLSGYIGEFSRSETILNVYDNVKYFFGLGFVLFLFWYNRQYNTDDTNYAKIFVNEDDNYKFVSQHNLPDDLKDTIFDIKVIDNPIGKRREFNKDYIDCNISKIGKLLTHYSKSEKILQACKWYYEGEVGNNELLSFIQNTVAMEILLGDKSKSDIIGIGELLRNRCAYLISRNSQERKHILSDFNDIYDVRSQIVHRGKSKLNSEERDLLNKLRHYCAMVIKKEIDLLEL